jgi:23S rRNA pseudouridine2605 synthase
MTTTSLSLSKFLAQAGVASRRKVVDLIEDGLIKVNGMVIKEPGYKINLTDTVIYQGQHIRAQKKIYIMLNKPKNYITTVSDEKGRKTVMDIIGDLGSRLYPIGRLDRDTTGLLIITNDGQLAQSLAHPRFGVQKIYTVMLNRPFAKDDMDQLKKGLQLSDGFIRIDAAGYIAGQTKIHVKVMLHSGKNRIVRRIFDHLGYTVIKLDRTGYAGLTKKGLPVGKWRYLDDEEITALYQVNRKKNNKERLL